MESFDYLLDLAMAITDGQADPEALREAYVALKAMDDERGRASELWHEGARALPASMSRKAGYFVVSGNWRIFAA